ncbi:hypothetical protein Hanom_Chr15g01364881 [Helianthus anomalus]
MPFASFITPAAFLAMKSTQGKLLVFQSGKPMNNIDHREPHKLLQPVDKTLKTMVIEFAEYQMYYYHLFYALFDPAKLYNDLQWNVTRPQGFEAMIRVRCSQRLQVQEYSGNFCKCIPVDVDLPATDRFLLAFKLHRLRQSYHGNSETR